MIHDHVREALIALVDILPTGWSRAFQRVELYSDGTGGTLSVFYIHAEDSRVLAIQAPGSMIVRWEMIRALMPDSSRDWSAANLVLEPNGKFQLDYEYVALEGEPLTRQRAWLRTVAPELELQLGPPKDS